jgi:hypothetical protein
MEQKKYFLVATSTLNDLLKQQQRMTDDEGQLSKVCFAFVFLLLLLFVDFLIEIGNGDTVTLRNEKIG